MKKVACLLLTAGLLVPAPAGAGPRMVARAKERLTIQGSGLRRTQIYVPRDATLNLNYWAGKGELPTFRGEKGFSVVVLIKVGQFDHSFTIARLPKKRGKTSAHVSLGPDYCMIKKACRIPQGLYNVYLASEKETSVRLTLNGLESGSSTVRPRTPVKGALGGPTDSYWHTTPSAPVEVAAHGAAFSPQLTGRSNFVFSSFWFRGNDAPVGPPPVDKPVGNLGDAGGCTYRGARASDPYAYAPGCPGGSQHGNFSHFKLLNGVEYLQWGSLANMGPGEFGTGYFAWNTGIKEKGFRGLWFEMEP